MLDNGCLIRYRLFFYLSGIAPFLHTFLLHRLSNPDWYYDAIRSFLAYQAIARL